VWPICAFIRYTCLLEGLVKPALPTAMEKCFEPVFNMCVDADITAQLLSAGFSNPHVDHVAFKCTTDDVEALAQKV
jgi:hypothetical protein